MALDIKVTELDDQVKFLNEQADRLEQLARERSYRWAEVQARTMRKIRDTLLQVRREMQMTAMSGKRIE